MPKLKLFACLALILIGFCVVGFEIHRFFKPSLPNNRVYFYNTETKTLFASSDKLLSPIDTESGPSTGVKAYVFKCDDSTNRFIGYLEKMTPEGKAAALEGLKNNNSPLDLGFFIDQHPDFILVRNLQDETWYPKASAAGAMAMTAGRNSGGCEHPAACLP